MRKSSPLLIVAAIVVIGLLAIVAWGQLQTESPSEIKAITGDCDTEPYVTVSARDAVNPGTAVTSLTLTYALNDKYIGTLTSGSSGADYAYGDSLDILVSKSNYLDILVEDFVVDCGNNPLVVDLYATDDGTLKVFNDVGNVVNDELNAGGTANQSASATTITQEVKLTSVSDQNLGDLLVVVEAHNTTQVDDILLSDGSHTSVSSIGLPDFHTAESATTGSIMKAFIITANNYLSDGKSDTYTLSIKPESGQTIGTTDMNMSLTMYTQQWFSDIDGSFVYGYENSDGTDKTEDTFDYDWQIV